MMRGIVTSGCEVNDSDPVIGTTEPCRHCGKPTQLYESDRPICVACSDQQAREIEGSPDVETFGPAGLGTPRQRHTGAYQTATAHMRLREWQGVHPHC